VKSQRQKDVLDYILLRGSIRVEELSEEFGVSAMTVRRDLQFLEQGGLIQRMAGKAVAVYGPSKEPSYKLRMYSNPSAKERIARLAAGLVNDGELIFLDIGSTCLQVAKRLCGRDITVVTNWLPNLVELSKAPLPKVINTAGQLNKEELSFVGELAHETLSMFAFTKAFIGVGGVDSQGISDFRLESVLAKRKVMQLAREVIVVADDTKFGASAPIHVGDYERIQKIVLADVTKVDPNLLQQFERLGIQLVN
jgi:DeoR/GlpR family transcriptional regulator of sugar metabolism